MAAPFPGIARKTVLPLFALTAIGWLMVVIGFGIHTEPGGHVGFPVLYPPWMLSLCGPLLIGCAIAHAAIWQKPATTILGAITAFLSVPFLTALGMIMFDYGNYIPHSSTQSSGFFLLMFVGSVIAALFWTPVMVLWHCYAVHPPEYSPINAS